MKYLVTLLVLLIVPGVGLTEEIRKLEIESQDKMYKVSVNVFVEASPRDVMHVLTNFNHLDWISGAILDSRLLDNPSEGRFIVFVRMRACFGIFCREFDQVQRVRRISTSELIAETLPRFSDMEHNTTRWEVSPEANGSRLEWTTEVKHDFWIPPLIGDRMIRRGLQRQGERTAAGIEKLAQQRASQRG